MTQLIAIIRGVEAENILEITEGLLEAGVDTLEVSLSNEQQALECIRTIKIAYGNQLNLGAGTVISEQQADKALEAGATFLITPGWDKELAKYILSKDVPIFPGVFSPGEIMQAASLGIETVKLFPVSDLGSSFIKNVKGPFPNMKFMAVGGVTHNNIAELKNAGCSYFAIGSDLVPRGATKKDKEKIKKNAEGYIKLLEEV